MATPLLAEFPELAHLSREDLEDLVSDTEYFQAIFYSLERVKALQQAQDELASVNEQIAHNNLALQDQLYQLRARTKDEFDAAKVLEARWHEVEKQQRELYQKFSPQFLLLRLRHATTALDDQTEALATAFIRQSSSHSSSSTVTGLVPPNHTTGTGTPGGADIDAFVHEFKELRKLYHKRMIWGERWNNGLVEWRE